jgi:hypothetical protein
MEDVTCPICLTGRRFHSGCLAAALGWIAHGDYQASTVETDLARQLAPTCYLCGTAPTEHVEHVVPKSRGGGDQWSNIGGACAPCNRAKSNRLLQLTKPQQDRFDQHQTAYRAAWSRVTHEAAASEILRLVYAGTTYTPGDPLEWIAEAIEDELFYCTDQQVTSVVAEAEQITAQFAQNDVRLAFFP